MGIFQSFRFKLIIFSLCISILPIAIITTVHYLNARTMLKDEVLKELTAIAESRKLHLTTFLQANEIRATDFGSDSLIRDSLEKIRKKGTDEGHVVKELNRYLLTKKTLDKWLAEMAVADTSGIIVSSTNPDMVGKNISRDEDFVLAKQGTHIKQPFYYPEADIKCLCILSPIESRNSGDMLGIVISTINLDALGTITSSRVGMGNTGEVLLVRKDRDSIAFLTSLRYAPDAPLSLYIPMGAIEAEPMRLAIEGGSGVLIAPDYRNVKVLAAYQYIPSTGWGLVAKIDKQEAFAPLRTLGIVALILGLTSAVVVATVGIIYASSVTKPIDRLRVATEKFASGDLGQRLVTTRKDEIGILTRTFNIMAEKISEGYDLLEKAHLDVAYKLAELTEKRDPETGQHLNRVTKYCSLLAEELSNSEKYKKVVDKEFTNQLANFSRLHDIGKVGIRDDILLKPGPLTGEEYKEMTRHSILGGDLLEGVDYLKIGRNIALYHHERWDGKGYPFGLSGEEIPLEARIVSLIDVYDALTTKRPYKKAIPAEDAAKIIKGERGKAFDPDIVDAFLRKLDEFRVIQTKYKETEYGPLVSLRKAVSQSNA